jgi:proline iminopeptidase
MPQMIECAVEALDACGISEPIDVIGHSMGGLCALAFTLDHPQRVKRLMIVDSLASPPARRRYKALPWNWKITQREFWQCAIWGARLQLGLGNQAVHKKLDYLLDVACCYDQRHVTPLTLTPEDYHTPVTMRDRWTTVAMRLDYRARLSEISIPTLVIVGRHDPLTPLPYSEELIRGIPNSHLVIFENSGHAPFIEEPELFQKEMMAFLEK